MDDETRTILSIDELVPGLRIDGVTGPCIVEFAPCIAPHGSVALWTVPLPVKYGYPKNNCGFPSQKVTHVVLEPGALVTLCPFYVLVRTEKKW